MKPTLAISVPTDEIAAVTRWAAQTPERPWIENVVFRNNEYMACDGHRMVRVPCPTHGHVFGIHQADIAVAVAAQKALLRGDSFAARRIEFLPGTNGRCIIKLAEGAGAALDVKIQDIKQYPDIATTDRLCAHEPAEHLRTPPVPYGVNPAYLQGMADIHAANCRANPTGKSLSERGVILKSWHAKTRAALLFENDNGVRFLIMPMVI